MDERKRGTFAPGKSEFVALISEKALNRMRHDEKTVFEPIFKQLNDVLGICGAPFDVALLSDLEKLPSYRFYFVLNLPAAPPEEYALVDRCLVKNK